MPLTHFPHGIDATGGGTILGGFDPDQVDDANEFGLGTRGFADDGTEWIYLEADATIDASDAAIIHTDGGAQALTTTLAAADAGTGKMVAVAPANPSQTIAAGKFFWGCRCAPATAGVLVNVEASCADFVKLSTHATAGHLDDTNLVGTQVLGIVITTAATASAQPEIAVINYPQIWVDTNA